ncbi:MAG: uroporphyrinogen-III synthase [Zetaproteobacteria bacterium CG_4_9_14_3_um_filter_53_7]|nr:MAG: uroporphyrinogen-III synthase [Zetaproteobacteria bacterium CG_4_9_14_3_um_filter_53_7]
MQRLEGKHVLLTRTVHQNAELDGLVRHYGAEPVMFPCLEMQPMADAATSGLSMLDECSDVVFSSSNAIHILAQLFIDQGLTLASVLAGKRIAVVGTKTAEALKQYHVTVDLVPRTSSQDGLVEVYLKHGLPRSGLMFFRADEGREALATALTSRGVMVVMVPVYRMTRPTSDCTAIKAALANGVIDAVLLGSAKAAHNYKHRINDINLANQPVIVVISDKLAVAAKNEGLNVQVVAQDASFESMLDALSAYYESISS